MNILKRVSLLSVALTVSVCAFAVYTDTGPQTPPMDIPKTNDTPIVPKPTADPHQSKDTSTSTTTPITPSTTPKNLKDNEHKNLVEIVTNDPNFSDLVTALTATDLIPTLQGQGPFTIFAPNNRAFAKLSPEKMNDLLRSQNKDKLASILTFHVVPGKLKASEIRTGKVKTINGKDIDVKVNGSQITVNGAQVIRSDIVGDNGVIHVIDTVLVP